MNRTRKGSAFRSWKVWMVAALAVVNGFVVPAQETNRVGQTDFSAFQVITQRNIFNPNRTARHRERNRSQNVADAFSLVGTMSYEKGTFAFFDGTSSDYRKVLQNAGAIAGYKVTEITPDSVKLKIGDRQVEMKVGAQMRHEEHGDWQLVANAASLPDSVEDAGSTPGEASSSSFSGEVNDVLKRLMQQREQESK